MTGLKITDVERIVVHVPFTPRCQEWNSLLVWDWGIVEVIRLQTDAGLVGYGETLLHYSWGRVTDAAVERVKGGNPAAFLGDDSLGPGLQMAMYDVVGKALGVPVYALLGTKVRDRCPIAWWNTKMAPEALALEAQEAVAAGYTAHKFKSRPWIDVYGQVEAVSAVTPPYYKLDMDWNGMLLSAGNAIPVLQELDRYERTAIYETPIPHLDLEGYRRIRDRVSRPIAAHWNAQPYPPGIRDELVDGYVVGGGVGTVMRHGILSAEFNKNFWLQLVGTGLTTTLAAHLGAVLTHARWPAVTCMNNYADDLLVEPLKISSGLLEVPTAPGLGIEVDEDALDRYRMEPPHSLPERRHILSVVWPSGQVVHYARMQQCWDDFLAGNHPVQERGVVMEINPEADASDPTAWKELYERACLGPVYDRR